MVDCAKEHLAGDAPRVPRLAQIGQHIPHDPLGLAIGVGFRIVEEIDAGIERGSQQLARLIAPDAGTEGDPRAEGQRRELQAGTAEATVLHAVLQGMATDRGAARTADAGDIARIYNDRAVLWGVVRPRLSTAERLVMRGRASTHLASKPWRTSR